MKFRRGVGETICYGRRRALGGERFAIDRRDRAIQILEQRCEDAVGARDYYFARRDSRDFLEEIRYVANLRDEKFAGRYVERRDRESISRTDDRQQIIFLRGGEHHL